MESLGRIPIRDDKIALQSRDPEGTPGIDRGKLLLFGILPHTKLLKHCTDAYYQPSYFRLGKAHQLNCCQAGPLEQLKHEFM